MSSRYKEKINVHSAGICLVADMQFCFRFRYNNSATIYGGGPPLARALENVKMPKGKQRKGRRRLDKISS